MAACGKQTSYDVPASFEVRDIQAEIYPDYKDIVVPENIAPLNFMIEGAEGMVVTLQGNDGKDMTVSGADRIDMDSAEWRNLLKGNLGKEIKVTVYTMENQKWYKHKEHGIKVAESIDPYLSYTKRI